MQDGCSTMWYTMWIFKRHGKLNADIVDLMLEVQVKNIAEFLAKPSSKSFVGRVGGETIHNEVESEDEPGSGLSIKAEFPEHADDADTRDLEKASDLENSTETETYTSMPLVSIDNVIKSEEFSTDGNEVEDTSPPSMVKGRCIFCGYVANMVMWKSHMYEQHYDEILCQDETLFDHTLSNSSKMANKVKCLLCNCVVLINFFINHLQTKHGSKLKTSGPHGNLRQKVMCLICKETVAKNAYSNHLRKLHPMEQKSLKSLTKHVPTNKNQGNSLAMAGVDDGLMLECVYCEPGNILSCADYNLHVRSMHSHDRSIEKGIHKKTIYSECHESKVHSKKGMGRKKTKGKISAKRPRRMCTSTRAASKLNEQKFHSKDETVEKEHVISQVSNRKFSKDGSVNDGDSDNSSDTVYYAGDDIATSDVEMKYCGLAIDDVANKEFPPQPVKGQCPYCGMISVYTTVKVHMYKTHYEEIMDANEPGGIEHSDKKVLKVICQLCGKEVFRKYLPIHMGSEHPEHYVGGETCTVDIGCVLCGLTIRNRQYRPHLRRKHPQMFKQLDNLVRTRGTSGTRKPKKIEETVGSMEINCVYCTDNKTVNYMRYRDHVGYSHPSYSKIMVRNISIVKRTLKLPKKLPTNKKTTNTTKSVPNPVLETNREYLTIDRVACLPPLPSPPKEYYCASCDEKFFTKRSYKKHASEAHKYPKDHVYVCNYCYQLFETVAKGQNHEDEVHALEKYQCETCGKLFTRASSLRMHKECIHLGIKRIRKSPRTYRDHICSYCGKIFKLASVLENHILRAHKHEKNVCCDECDKRFVDKSELTKHKLTHLDKKDYKYQCSYCSYKAVRKHIMVYHERIHTGEKPYLCNLCGSRHRIGLTFRSHMLNKHGIELRGSEEHQKYYHPETPANLCDKSTHQLQETLKSPASTDKPPEKSTSPEPIFHTPEEMQKLSMSSSQISHTEIQHSQTKTSLKVPSSNTVDQPRTERNLEGVSTTEVRHPLNESMPNVKSLPPPLERIQSIHTDLPNQNLEMQVQSQAMSTGYFIKPPGSAYQTDTFQHPNLSHFNATSFPQITNSDSSFTDYSRLVNFSQEWAHEQTGMSDRFSGLNQAYKFYASTLQGNMDKSGSTEPHHPGPKDYSDNH